MNGQNTRQTTSPAEIEFLRSVALLAKYFPSVRAHTASFYPRAFILQSNALRAEGEGKGFYFKSRLAEKVPACRNIDEFAERKAEEPTTCCVCGARDQQRMDFRLASVYGIATTVETMDKYKFVRISASGSGIACFFHQVLQRQSTAGRKPLRIARELERCQNRRRLRDYILHDSASHPRCHS